MRPKKESNQLAWLVALLVLLGATSGGFSGAMAQDEDIPEVAKALLEEGDRHRQAGRVTQAIASYEEVRRLAPTTVAVYTALGALYHGQGDLDRALEMFSSGLEHDPRQFSLLFNAAVIARQLGQTEAALGYVDRAIATRPRAANLHSLRGAVLRDLGRAEEALAAQRSAAKLDSGDPQIQYRLGNLYHELGRKNEAIEAYRKAIKKKKDYLRAYYNLGAVLFEMDQYNEALEAYLVALKPVQEAFAAGKEVEPANARAYLNLGAIYFRKRDWGKALDAYDKALRLDPQQGGALYNQGYIHYQEGQYAAAAEAYQKALELDSDLPLARLHLGEIYLRRGEPVAAVTMANQALASLQGTERLRANLVLARSHALLGQKALAREAYRSVLAENPQHLDSLVALARMLRDEGDTQGAGELLERARGLAPEDAGVALELAGMARSEGDLAAEKKLYEEILQRSGDVAEVWPVRVNLARVLVEQGQHVAARQAFEPVIARLAKLSGSGLQAREGQVLATVHGLLLASEGKMAEARRHLRSVGADAPAPAREALAVLNAFAGDAASASEVLKAALSKYLGQPLEHLARANLGQVLWLAGRPAEAKVHLDRAASALPDRAGLRVALGEIAFAEGDDRGAIRWLEEARDVCASVPEPSPGGAGRELRVTLGRSTSPALCERASKSLATVLVRAAYGALEQARGNGLALQNARQWSDRALALPLTVSEQALVYFVRGTARLLAGADRGARDDLTRTLGESLPQDLRALARNNLGVAMYRLGETDGARGQFEAVTDQAEAGLNLGILLDEKTDEKRRALEFYEAYLARGGRRTAEVEAWAERLGRIYR